MLGTHPYVYTPDSGFTFNFGPLTTTIETSSSFNSWKARTASRMRNSPTPVPPTVTRIVFLRNTKSSRSVSRGALNARTIGPMRRTLGQPGADSAARMRSAPRAIREAQKLAGPSTKRDTGSRAKLWRVASGVEGVGIRWRSAPRAGGHSLSEGGEGG